MHNLLVPSPWLILCWIFFLLWHLMITVTNTTERIIRAVTVKATATAKPYSSAKLNRKRLFYYTMQVWSLERSVGRWFDKGGSIGKGLSMCHAFSIIKGAPAPRAPMVPTSMLKLKPLHIKTFVSLWSPHPLPVYQCCMLQPWKAGNGPGNEARHLYLQNVDESRIQLRPMHKAEVTLLIRDMLN